MSDNEGCFYIFANPAACGGLTPERHDLLRRLCQRLGATLLGPDTNSAEEFDGLIQQTIKPGDWVVFAGGDGTLHDGLNAVYERDVTIGYIPFGTGNAAAYAFSLFTSGPQGVLGLPGEERLYDVLAKGRVQTIDLVRVSAPILGRSHVALFASAGWCALMAKIRDGRGLLGYLVPALKNVAGDYYSQHVSVTIDDAEEWTSESTFIVVAKSPYYGSGITVVPDAQLDDGYLHTAVYCLSRAEMPALYASSFVGFKPQPNLAKPGLRVELASRADDVPLQIDGDYVGDTPEVSFELVPAAVRVITGLGLEDGTAAIPPTKAVPPVQPAIAAQGRPGWACENCRKAIVGGQALQCTRCAAMYHGPCWQAYNYCTVAGCGCSDSRRVRVGADGRLEVLAAPLPRAHIVPGPPPPVAVYPVQLAPTPPPPPVRDTGGELLCPHCGQPIVTLDLPCPFCDRMPR